MLVKAQGMPVAVLTCDSFANFSSCHAAPLPLVCHLLPRCWGVKVEWRGKDDVRFCIAMDKVCKAEMIWLRCWKCGDHRQLSNSHSLYFFLLYRNGQLCLPHGLHLVFPCECLPLASPILHLISALTQDGFCCDIQSDEISEGGLWLPEQSSPKHSAGTSALPRAAPVRCLGSSELFCGRSGWRWRVLGLAHKSWMTGKILPWPSHHQTKLKTGIWTFLMTWVHWKSVLRCQF